MNKASKPGLPPKPRLKILDHVRTRLLAVAFVVPLNSDLGWQILSYKKIAANTVAFSAAGMNVKVKSSASPIIYKLPQVNEVEKITVKGRLKGQMKLSAEVAKQGAKGFDDFVFRVGLVVPGNKKLNFFQRKIAPNWVLQLHKLAPADSGVDRIEFFNVVNDKSLLGQKRTHPLSDLIVENFVWQAPAMTENGTEFEFVYELPQKMQAAALWLAIDGDDTKSEFEIEILSMSLN